MFYYWPDYYYIVLVLPALLLSMAAQLGIKRTYSKYSAVLNSRGITGAMAAQAVLSHYAITNVRIERTTGTLSDHFDPRSNVIRLSPQVYSGTSVAAVGIACHEAGHAAQYAKGYAAIKLRNAVLPVANIGSSCGILIAVVGYFLSSGFIVNIGIILFSFVALFQLITLPVEINASKRAMAVIGETGLLSAEESKKASKVLIAAAMTYVAALLVSLASLLRLILRFSSKKDR